MVYAVYVGFQNGAFALLLYPVLYLAACLVHHFLYAGGVYAAVGDELFKRYARYLAAYLVEAGDCDSLRRIVYDKVYASQRFYRLDVSSLAADDPALHIVVRQGNYRYGCFGDLICGAAAYRERDILSCAVLALVLYLRLVSGDPESLFVSKLILQAV